MRCSKCKHLWHAMPLQPVEAEATPDLSVGASHPQTPETQPATVEEEALAPRSVQAEKPKRPSIKKKKTLADERAYTPKVRNPLRGFAYGLVYTVLLMVIGGVWTVKEHPDWLGFQASQGFAFEAMKVARMPQLGGERFTSNPMYALEGVVRNISDMPRPRPPLKITLKDNAGGVVYVKEYPSPESLIPSGEAVSFTIEKLEQPYPEAQLFAVEMGNALEFWLRKVPVSETGHAKD